MGGTIWLARGGRAEAEVRVANDVDETALFAVEELRRFARRMGGADLPVRRAKTPKGSVWVGPPGAPAEAWSTPALEGDAYAIGPAGGGALIQGARPRALLYGVYDLLRELGCRWFEPGETGECVPHRPEIGLAPRRRVERPRFAIRGLVHGPYPILAEWMARNGLNSTIVYGLRMAEISASGGLEALRLRDLSAEFGHHDFKRYFISPQTYFESHPEWFGLRGGKRTGGLRGVCLCLTNAAMQAQFARNVAALLEAHPWVDRVSVWPDDGFRPCECEACRREYSAGRNMSDYVLRFVNRIATEFPARRFSHIAYQAMRAFPLVERPLPNVDLCCAETNEALLGAWRRWLDWDMAGGRRSARRLYVYAYWGGYTAYAMQTRHHPSDVQEQLDQLEAAGADGFLTQSNFFYPTAYATNLVAAAALSWRGRRTASDVMRDYCRRGFGAGGAVWRRFLERIDGRHGAFGRNTLPASRLARDFMDAPANSRAVQAEAARLLAAAYEEAGARFRRLARGRAGADTHGRAALEVAAFDYNLHATRAYSEAFRGMDLLKKAQEIKDTDRVAFGALAGAADAALAAAEAELARARCLLDALLEALGRQRGEEAEKAGVAPEVLSQQAQEIAELRRSPVLVDAGLVAHQVVAAPALRLRRGAGGCTLEPYVRTATHLASDRDQLVFRAGDGTAALEIEAAAPEQGSCTVTVSLLRKHGFGRWRASLAGGPAVVIDASHADAAMQEWLIGDLTPAGPAVVIAFEPCEGAAGQDVAAPSASVERTLVIDAAHLALRRAAPALVKGP